MSRARRYDFPLAGRQEPTARLDLVLYLNGGQEIATLDASIWAPSDADTPGSIELQVASGFERLRHSSPGPYSLRGQKRSITVIGEGVWLASAKGDQSAERKLSRPVLEIDQIDRLTIDHAIKLERNSETFAFFLTDCKSLNPAEILSFGLYGEVEREVVRSTSCVIPNIGKARFLIWRRRTDLSPRLSVVSSFLVCELERAEGNTSSGDSIEEEVNRLLILAGFFARKPVRIWGTQHVDAAGISKSYRQALSSWSLATNARDQLVDPIHFEATLQHGAVKVNTFGPNLRTKFESALIVCQHPGDVMDDQFRALFSALETLASAFGRLEASDLAFAAKERNERVKEELRAHLQSMYAKDERIDVEGIQGKLNTIGSVSAKQRFTTLTSAFAVEISDLWPVYEGGASLYAIRNRLSHGSTLPDDLAPSLHVALLHLRLVLERCLLGVLEMSVEHTDCSPSRVAGMIPVSTASRYQDELGQFLKKK